jgi:hypothetical protein
MKTLKIPVLLVALCVAVFAAIAPPSTAFAWGGATMITAPPFNGGTITNALILPSKTCATMEVGFGATNSGICDNGGGSSRPTWYANGTQIFEASTAAGFAVTSTSATFAGAVTIKKNLLSSTSTMTNAGSGSCTSVTVTGTVIDGTVTATCTAAQTVVVTFSDGFGASPNCTITSANAAAGGVTTGTPYQSAGATTSATFTFPAVTAGKYNVICAL